MSELAASVLWPCAVEEPDTGPILDLDRAVRSAERRLVAPATG